MTSLFVLARHTEVERWARPVLINTRDPIVAARMAWALAQALLGQTQHEHALAVVADTMRQGSWIRCGRPGYARYKRSS